MTARIKEGLKRLSTLAVKGIVRDMLAELTHPPGLVYPGRGAV